MPTEVIDKRARNVLVALAVRLGWQVTSFEQLEDQLVHGNAPTRSNK